MHPLQPPAVLGSWGKVFEEGRGSPKGKLYEYWLLSSEWLYHVKSKLINSVVSESWKIQSEHDVAQFSSMISGLSEEERSRCLKQRLLQDLQFLEMPDSHERIATVHRQTFKIDLFESSEVRRGGIHISEAFRPQN